MAETADVIVIGLGAVGSATLYRLARRGVNVVGIDRYAPPHDQGSSHGETRISRLGVGEGEAYVPLVRRAHAIWAELKAETGETLFQETGGLILGPRAGAANHHGKGDFVRRSIELAEAQSVAHEVLDADEIVRRYPQFGLTGNEVAYYEPTAGMIFPERCVDVQLRLARALGARTHVGESVATIRQHADGGVVVETERRTVHAARAVLAAGPWMADLAGAPIARVTDVYRQSLHWFEADDPAAYAPGRFPIFIWFHGDTQEDYLYGFPALPGATAVKVASERYADPTSPAKVDRDVPATESAEIHRRHVAGRLRGVRAECHRAAACLYTVSRDAGFIVDRLPDHPDVIVASACSGHGFKHSPAVGELIAEQATADEPRLIDAFALSRFDGGR